MEIDWIVSGVDCVDKRGNPYYVVAIAKDVQTGDFIVVFNQNFGAKETLCCLLDAFKVSFSPMENGKEAPTETQIKTPDSTNRMMMFFDSDNTDDKIRILNEMHIMGELNDTIIDNMAATLDVVINEGVYENRFDELKRCLETKARYESLRLRKA